MHHQLATLLVTSVHKKEKKKKKENKKEKMLEKSFYGHHFKKVIVLDSHAASREAIEIVKDNLGYQISIVSRLAVVLPTKTPGKKKDQLIIFNTCVEAI